MFIPGSLGNVLRRADLPKVEESIWYPGIGPTDPLAFSPDPADTGINLGVLLATSIEGVILGVCFWRWSALASSSGTIGIWMVDNELSEAPVLLDSKGFTGHSGTGWKRVDFDTPVPVSASHAYKVGVHLPESGDGLLYYGGTPYYFSGGTAVYSENGLIWAWPNSGSPFPPHGIYKHNGQFKYGAFDCPNDQYGSANYWIDAVLQGSPSPQPPDPPIILKWEIPAGYPDLSNTGIPPGTTLTPVYGELASSTDGEIFEDLDITDGGINIAHQNCIIRRCKIYYRGLRGIGINFGCLGTIIEDCDINMGFRSNPTANGVGGSPLALRRCNIYRGENGLAHYGSYGDGSVQQIFEDNFIHHLRSSPGSPHYDCMQFNGGQGNILIRHNTLHNENTDTSAILIENLHGPITNIQVEDNILCGGGFTSYCVGRTSDPSIDPVIVQYHNNQMRCGAFGYIIDTGTDPDMRGNQFMDHGEIYDAEPPDGFVEDQIVRERFFGMPNGVGIIPGSIVWDAVSGITLGVSFQVAQDTDIVGVNIPKIRTPGETLGYKVGVWRFTGANRNAGNELLYQETINYQSGTREGWEHLALTTPVAVEAGDNILLGVWCPPGADGRIWFTVVTHTFGNDVVSQFGRATAFNGAGVPLNGFTGGNGLFNYGPDLVPPLDQTGSRPSYNIDPIFEAPWVVDVEPPPPTGSIPLTFDDPRFDDNTVSGGVVISSGILLEKTITVTEEPASIVAEGNVIIDTCRVDSRECIRMAGSIVDIRNSYLRAEGEGEDHADVIQAYDPGQHTGQIIVTDTAIVMGTTAINGGLFCADDWGGTVTLNNVMFQGGLYGLILYADAGCTINVSLTDVFFVGPFTYGEFAIEAFGSGVINITHWENVRHATIVDGVLVPGDLIEEP